MDTEVLAKLDEVLEELRQQKDELAVQQQLIAQDRVQLARLLILANRLVQTGKDVAKDLAASIERADGAPAVPGAGADAALRSAGGA